MNDTAVGADLSRYKLIVWPDSQEYMEYDWFIEEAILDVSGENGDCAYWIPITRIEEIGVKVL